MSYKINNSDNIRILEHTQLLNWVLTGIMSICGWYLHSLFIAQSILLGGLIIGLSFLRLKSELISLFSGQLVAVKFRFFLKYYTRLSVLAFLFFVIIKYALVHPIGLIIGLSTIVLSISLIGLHEAKRYFIQIKEA
jgi:hypothetical protein